MHAYEVQYFYQNIWTTPGDLAKGEIKVYNENFFRDLSAYLLFFTSRYLKETPVQIENGFYTLRCIGWWNIIYKEDKSMFVEVRYVV